MIKPRPCTVSERYDSTQTLHFISNHYDLTQPCTVTETIMSQPKPCILLGTRYYRTQTLHSVSKRYDSTHFSNRHNLTHMLHYDPNPYDPTQTLHSVANHYDSTKTFHSVGNPFRSNPDLALCSKTLSQTPNFVSNHYDWGIPSPDGIPLRGCRLFFFFFPFFSATFSGVPVAHREGRKHRI